MNARARLLLQVAGESIAAFHDLILPGLFARLFVERWPKSASALKKENESKKQQQSQLHRPQG